MQNTEFTPGTMLHELDGDSNCCLWVLLWSQFIRLTNKISTQAATSILPLHLCHIVVIRYTYNRKKVKVGHILYFVVFMWRRQSTGKTYFRSEAGKRASHDPRCHNKTSVKSWWIYETCINLEQPLLYLSRTSTCLPIGGLVFTWSLLSH
jgi:hypothetical protein